MAKLTKFLGNVVGGIFGSEGDMKDYQHASRLFTDDYMRLAPKVEFLYHVVFDINDGAARSPTTNAGWNKSLPKIELGMLVKACQIPGVQLNTETKNQYGKKTNIQTQAQYTPVSFTFHDDNSNLVSGMWQQYFKNYYADSNYPDELARQPTYNSSSTSSKDAQQRENTQNKSLQQTRKYSFGLTNDNAGHFFRKVSIYQLSRHKFYEYTLINPLITSWTGPNLNYGSSQPAENQMQLIYEGIKYGEGRVSTDNPDGFAQLHYDKSPSPLSIMGGGTAGLFGSNGVIAGGLDVFGDIASGNAFANPLAFVGTAIKAKNTYDNAKQLTKQGIRNEIENVATGAITNTIANNINVPSIDKLNNSQATVATGENEVPANNKDIQTKADNNDVVRRGSAIDPNTGAPTEFLNNTDYTAWRAAGEPSEWTRGQGAETTVDASTL